MSGLKDYDILKLVGEGAFASVFRVKRKCDSKEYALKRIKLNQMNQKEVSNSLNEVRLLASIKSSYIIAYKDAFIDQATKSLCIITEFADGGDLSNKIKALKKSNRFMDEEEVWKIAIRLIHGLKHLHSMNVFHRDLKTANILISQDGAKLGDLNVSVVSKNGMAYTQTGTPYYASPQVWNSKPYDNKCDIWSLGCVIYELTSHKPPFHGNGMEDLWRKINKGVYDSLPFCYSSDLSAFIALCLKTKPSQRPNAESLFKNPLIRKRIHLFSKQQFNKQSQLKQQQKQNNKLLQTIKIAKNINYRLLKEKLPKSSFDTKQNKSCLIQRNQPKSTRTALMKIENLPSLRRAQSVKRYVKPSSSKERQPKHMDKQNIPPMNRKRERSMV